MLSHFRVIDRTAGGCLLAGQILADLGADVIQVEPRGGSPARRTGPFESDVVDPERSLHWWAYARGKRSIALDLDDERDRATFHDLLDASDVLIDSERPGAPDDAALGPAALARRHPGL